MHDILENISYYCGRWYGLDGNIRRGKYLFPIDEEELDALDIFHKFFLVARHNSLFSAPLDLDHRLRVLDLGTGTGIWAVDMATKYTHFDIHSIDFNKIQPAMIPMSMRPPQEVDIEGPWNGIEWNWDFIHLRMLYGSVSCWEGLYSKIFSHLTAGIGHVEHVELDLCPKYDLKSISRTAIDEWSEKLHFAMDKHGQPMRVHPAKTIQLLKQSGFVDVSQKAIRICYSPWSDDIHENEAARWFNSALQHRLLGLSCAPMTTILDMSLQEVEDLCDRAHRDMCTLELRAHCKMYVWIGRKP